MPETKLNSFQFLFATPYLFHADTSSYFVISICHLLQEEEEEEALTGTSFSTPTS